MNGKPHDQIAKVAQFLIAIDREWQMTPDTERKITHYFKKIALWNRQAAEKLWEHFGARLLALHAKR